MTEWIAVCAEADLEPESARRFDHQGRTYAIYRSPEGSVHATDGLCTHEAIHLADGLVMDHEVECPKHSGVFDYRTGEAKRLPACINLRIHPARIEAGTIWIAL